MSKSTRGAMWLGHEVHGTERQQQSPSGRERMVFDQEQATVIEELCGRKYCKAGIAVPTEWHEDAREEAWAADHEATLGRMVEANARITAAYTKALARGAK